MQPSYSYNSFAVSLSNAKAVTGAESLYEAVREQAGKMVTVFVVFALGFPLVYAFGFWLLWKRKSFQKHMRKGVPEFTTTKQYEEFKQKLEQLRQLTPGLKKVTHYNFNNVPLLLRFTTRQMQKMSSTLLTFESWLESRLISYNNPQHVSSSDVFKFKQEKELWKERNKAYTYWM